MFEGGRQGEAKSYTARMDAAAVQSNPCGASTRRRHEIRDVRDAYARELFDDVASRESDLSTAALRLELLDPQRSATVGADADAKEAREALAFFDRERAVVLRFVARLDVEHDALERAGYGRGTTLSRRKRRRHITAKRDVCPVVANAEGPDQLFRDGGFE